MTSESQALAVRNTRTWYEWHCTLNYINQGQLQEMQRLGLIDGTVVDAASNLDFDCEICIQAEHSHSPSLPFIDNPSMLEGENFIKTPAVTETALQTQTLAKPFKKPPIAPAPTGRSIAANLPVVHLCTAITVSGTLPNTSTTIQHILYHLEGTTTHGLAYDPGIKGLIGYLDANQAQPLCFISIDISVTHHTSENNAADMFTKVLAHPTHTWQLALVNMSAH
ncbi:uncharacterized protein PHACADRAFT_197485 [Phanerochaete carnosa HHB-10118-sp]|uniref:GAG-pre-integrase domain-containing protein n=1 Tax=Phanerochaete carnosa (strain HHB-10118-sp) TaxID=650164 RepID=K5W2C5_PHACS|nr:uncharacterized protein PHACADRAFT_197485 [Phanerochaete carnosa HHB-10118-sp]EKM53054.1 hypothetical protein PHACADRAFT_197485 [Phanerochaete carnosa HHB-10118-sp]